MVVFAGVKVTPSVVVAPIFTETAVAGVIANAVGIIAFTVTVLVAVTVGDATLVAVIVTEPAETPVTTPAALTVAIAVFELLQVTSWFVVFAGVKVTPNVVVAPIFTDTAVAGVIANAVGNIEETVIVAVPDTVGKATLVAVIIAVP